MPGATLAFGARSPLKPVCQKRPMLSNPMKLARPRLDEVRWIDLPSQRDDRGILTSIESGHIEPAVAKSRVKPSVFRMTLMRDLNIYQLLWRRS